MTTQTYIIRNLITGEVKGTVTCNSLAAAQEYFSIMLPYMTASDMLYEVK